MSEKQTLPLLPLRGLVVYPHMMVNLDVGRDRSVAAIEHAIAGDSRILVVSQRDPECDDPAADDLFDVGTVAEIRQFLRMPEGVLRILVDGQKRAEILAVREGEHYAEADVQAVEEEEEQAPAKDVEALVHGVTSKFEEWVKLSHKIPPEALVSISIMEDTGRLADYSNFTEPTGRDDGQGGSCRYKTCRVTLWQSLTMHGRSCVAEIRTQSR